QRHDIVQRVDVGHTLHPDGEGIGPVGQVWLLGQINVAKPAPQFEAALRPSENVGGVYDPVIARHPCLKGPGDDSAGNRYINTAVAERSSKRLGCLPEDVEYAAAVP